MPGRVFQRGDIYWIAFYCKGKEYRTSAKTIKKREAEHLLAFYLGQVARGEFKGFMQRGASLSIAEVLDDFEEDCQERGLAGYDRIRSHLNAVRAYFKTIVAEAVTELHIARYKKHRLAQGRKHATINREIQYLGQALRLAEENKLLTSAPKVKKYQENNARQGFFEVEDFERVVTLLPEDIQDFVRFAYYSGWRRGEIAKLEWRHIGNEAIRLPPQISKNKDGRVLTLVGEIAEVIERRRTVQHSDAP